MTFTDQIAVVTGASRGIGRAIAEALAGHGAKVACVATTMEGAHKVAQGLEGARAYACDVGSALAVEELVTAVTTDMGTPSVLINNAGVTRDMLLMRMKDEEWDQVMSVNL